MKKIFVLMCVMSVIGVSNAEDEVYLDVKTPEIHKYNTGSLTYENKKLDTDDEDISPTLFNLKRMFDEDLGNKTQSKTKEDTKWEKF